MSVRGCAALLAALLAAGCAAMPRCPAAGVWVDPATGAAITDPLVRAASGGVVLLGEHHDQAADHRWELATIAALYRDHPDMAIGAEMFPRSAQPALDEWTAGRLSEAAFLDRTDWAHAWGFPAEPYLPIFRFARDHHLPLLALNVSQGLVHRVAVGGWFSIPVSAREGVDTPAPPDPAYAAMLRQAMGMHAENSASAGSLDRFIEAQTVWDRAMAERIAQARAANPRPLVVAIMGAGHLEHRGGVPHQLAALGVTGVAVLLPVAADRSCFAPDSGLADAVFLTP